MPQNMVWAFMKTVLNIELNKNVQFTCIIVHLHVASTFVRKSSPRFHFRFIRIFSNRSNYDNKRAIFEKIPSFPLPLFPSCFIISLVKISFLVLVYFGTFSLFCSFLHPTQFRVFSRRIHGAAGEGQEEDSVRNRSRSRAR